MNENNKKKSVKSKLVKPVIAASCVIFAASAVYCGAKYFSARREYRESAEAYAALTAEYVAPVPTPEPVEISVENGAEKTEKQKKSPIDVDFSNLCGQPVRGDVVGWLYCEDTVINYPVVHCDDNEFYVERLMDGTSSAYGTLISDCRCAADFTSPNTIVYGHHMQDGSMFNCLKNWRNIDGFLADHPSIYLNTPNGNYEMQIFSTFVTDTQSMAYKAEFSNEEEIQEYIDFLIEKSLIKTDVDVTPDDHILTLSTCSYEFNNARTVLCGVLVPIG